MGALIHGFEIIWKHDLPEMQAVGVYAKHKKTGLELYHILNDDEENLFAYSFMTASANSTGVAHILEHSVLCGSKNYPLKDPFVLLSRQSVKTFLNALTFPDKTVYPASSVVEADYFNLLQVYGDAVFFPLIEEWTFKQEGWRFEFDANNKLCLQGVVLNEMRGNYADFDSLMYDYARASVTQNSIYMYDSGGEPSTIPSLSYEQFRGFHKKYYHPCNCKLFLYGNIPTEKQMQVLHERFLSCFEPAEPPESIPPIPHMGEPVFLSRYTPASEGMDMDRCGLVETWLLPESDTAENLMDAFLLEEVLLGHDGSPLSKALLHSDFGTDLYVYNGCQADLKNILFFIGITGAEKGREREFKNFLHKTLQGFIEKGIDKKDIDSALNSIEFANREIRRGSGPFSLTLMQRSLRGWIHGKGPESSLRYIPAFEKLKAAIKTNPQYVERLIDKFLLQNKHSAMLSVFPDEDFSATLDAKLQKIAEAYEKTLTKEMRIKLQKEQEILLERQKEVDSEEKLALIPHLKKSDLPVPRPAIEETMQFFGEVPAIIHELPTNDIAYLQLAIPVDNFSMEEALYLPLYANALTGIDTHTLSWHEVSSELAYLTGNFSVSCVNAGDLNVQELPLLQNQTKLLREEVVGRSWLLIRAKMLPELIKPAVDFIFQYLKTAAFSDRKRLKDLLVQQKNDMDSAPAHSGHLLMLFKTTSLLSPVKAIDELFSGAAQIRFLRKLHASCAEQDFPESEAEKLKSIHAKILNSGMLVLLCGTAENLKVFAEALPPHLSGLKKPAPGKNLHVEVKTNFFAKQQLTLFPSALQVGFTAVSFPHFSLSDKQGVEAVFASWLSAGPLWERIRIIGGAYGAFTAPEPIESIFSCATYRDPDPLHSVSQIIESIESCATEKFDAPTMERLITGAYSTTVTPQSPTQKSQTAFVRFLNGMSEAVRLRNIQNLLNTQGSDMNRCAELLLAQKSCIEGAALGSDTQLRHTEEAARFFAKMQCEQPI
ncbi:peptidase M16 [Treponema phagedenis]|uniref:Peptidase M16 n=1 Tax=Treponema phagedenis TaxID=162 RepID=A0A0B7GR12_TREPH|nr:insulinase family protein [Treponema phagedenis]QEJ98830.1 peptidase M16 [Treponema phagedenis]QEK04335.1 peptidase M16 [Treponema phagedenis]QEK05487.1 peptidase M16 [Treponema phagedenis]QEK09989.1 peptidase M16 [Treponema phagedenis]QSH94019.1 peptidase M16 [Treponema phagedenis]